MDQSTAAEARIAVPAKEAARLVSVSPRHWYQLAAEGRVPSPIKFGGSVRWLVDDLRQWAAAGCPVEAKPKPRRARKAAVVA